MRNKNCTLWFQNISYRARRYGGSGWLRILPISLFSFLRGFIMLTLVWYILPSGSWHVTRWSTIWYTHNIKVAPGTIRAVAQTFSRMQDKNNSAASRYSSFGCENNREYRDRCPQRNGIILRTVTLILATKSCKGFHPLNCQRSPIQDGVKPAEEVVPIYILGRLRTGSSPSRTTTVMSSLLGWLFCYPLSSLWPV